MPYENMKKEKKFGTSCKQQDKSNKTFMKILQIILWGIIIVSGMSVVADYYLSHKDLSTAYVMEVNDTSIIKKRDNPLPYLKDTANYKCIGWFKSEAVNGQKDEVYFFTTKEKK